MRFQGFSKQRIEKAATGCFTLREAPLKPVAQRH